MSEWRCPGNDLPPPGRPRPITGKLARLVRVRLERVVKGSHGGRKHLSVDVLVALRHEQRRVAEQRLHGGRFDAKRSQDRGRRVTSIVQSRLRDPGDREKALPSPVILAWVHRLAQASSEDRARELGTFLPPVPRNFMRCG
jgi:hypothetical protein